MKRAKLAVLGLSGQSVFLSVDHFHQNGETVHAQALFHEPGGKGYNQAVAAARLGAQVSYLTAVGEDADGEECLARLREEGVEAVGVRKPEHTAYAAILTDAAGENRVTVYPGASASLTAGDVRERFGEVIASSDYLILQNEIPAEAFEEAFSLAEAHGVPVALNPAPFAPWAAPFLRRAQVITPNLSEAMALLGLREPVSPGVLARMLADEGYARAVVTLGGEGALALEGGRAVHIPAVPVRARDTTGAGDCFHAALTVRLAEGASLEEAARFAARSAALSVSRPHVLTAMPRRAELSKEDPQEQKGEGNCP